MNVLAAVVVLVLLALVAYGLERNHRREPYPRSRMMGGTPVQDRDVERIRAELRVVADRTETRPSTKGAVR